MEWELRREWIGLVLVLLGLLRVALLVAHDPLIGYGNQYDMHRTSACTGHYPAIAEPKRYEASPQAPLPLYRLEGVRRGACYMSSEVVIVTVAASAAKLFTGDSQTLPLQWVGYVKFFMLFATALLVAWALHHNPNAALLHGLIVLLVMSDPVVTLWYHTLYTEFAVIWSLYAIVAAICALAIADRGSIAMTALLAAGVGALAFSREQFALLGPLMLLAAWPWLWFRSNHATVAVFGVALVAAAVSFALLPRPGAVKSVNRADTYLGVVIPASSDPVRALEILRLPARCEAMIGSTWYMQRGENLQQACPEVFNLSSTAFLKFASDEPEALARSVARVLPALQALSPPYLGTLAGQSNVTLRGLPWYAYSPLHEAVSRLPTSVFAILVLAAVLLVPLALLAAFAWARPSRAQHGTSLLLAMLLGGIVTYSLVTTVFGDGLSEAARHFIPGALALVTGVIAFLVAAPVLVLRWIEAPKHGAFEIVAVVAGVAVIVAACIVTARWAHVQPLAIGALDLPTERQASPAGVRLRGWALDPFGVESVDVTLGKLRKSARYGEAETRDIEAVFPGYPDTEHARFVLDLTPEDLAQAGAQGDVPMRITVKNRAGAVTEIDRRRLTFPQ